MNTGLENIEKQLDEVYDLGIKKVFYMIHALNNGFGGCQLYQGNIQYYELPENIRFLSTRGKHQSKSILQTAESRSSRRCTGTCQC